MCEVGALRGDAHEMVSGCQFRRQTAVMQEGGALMVGAPVLRDLANL
jgi:hypothetical protein